MLTTLRATAASSVAWTGGRRPHSGGVTGVRRVRAATIVERITAGMERAASQGRWVVGKVPYGYLRDKATKLIHPNEPQADVVRRVFAMYVEGRMGGRGDREDAERRGTSDQERRSVRPADRAVDPCQPDLRGNRPWRSPGRRTGKWTGCSPGGARSIDGSRTAAPRVGPERSRGLFGTTGPTLEVEIRVRREALARVIREGGSEHLNPSGEGHASKMLAVARGRHPDRSTISWDAQ
jgi:hypothetical protein